VRSWIFSDDDNSFFSFRAVCDALAIDPKAVRKGLLQWENKKLAGQKPGILIRRSSPAVKRISQWRRKIQAIPVSSPDLQQALRHRAQKSAPRDTLLTRAFPLHGLSSAQEKMNV
jgi:hypothetical protein